MSDGDLRDAVQATRLQAKSARNMLRTLTQMLADLERLLEELDAEPMEAERDEHTESHGRADGDTRHAAYDHAA